MRSIRIAVLTVAGVVLLSGTVLAADKNDIKCLNAVAKAVQKASKIQLKALHKCREANASPAAAQCPDAKAQKQLNKAQKQLDKLSKKCKEGKFDPQRALGFMGCAASLGCAGTDQSIAGYLGCVDCTTDEATGNASRAVSDGACGNGFRDPGEECDGESNCDAQCRLMSVCGNGTIDPREECDGSATPNGCEAGHTCVPAGLFRECTCMPPCELDPVPVKMSFETEPPSGVCGCTLRSGDATSCSDPSKAVDLNCGDLLVGGGESAVPPGPSPDGAKNYTSFPVCGGTELIVGPHPGEGPRPDKNCTQGPDANGNPRCFFGPALFVENNNSELSTCVLNSLRKDVTGIADASTGSSTLTAELTSSVYLTGDLIKNRCRGGDMSRVPCEKAGQPRGPCGVCVMGSNDGNSCQDTSDCPGGTCDGVCAEDRVGKCSMGSSNAGDACVLSVCNGGLLAGTTCTDDSECMGATCEGACIGGSNDGGLCGDDSDCTGGTCSVNTCTGGMCEIDADNEPIQPCPTCVDANFDPITDGSTGMCDLGANQSMPCVSTNSLGLTIDCAPSQATFLQDLSVTLASLTTGTASMTADEDGRFCNFGECVGGTSSGADCNNNGDCPGGTCQKLCQGGSDAGMVCDDDDDCARGVERGSCGQEDPGAFGRSNVNKIIQTGTPAPAPLAVGDVKQAKVGTVFCIPRTTDNAINNAGSLPGPGATSLQGTISIFGAE